MGRSQKEESIIIEHKTQYVTYRINKILRQERLKNDCHRFKKNML